MLLLAAVPCLLIVVIFGLYLFVRDTHEPWLRRLGIGLLAYGVIFGIFIVRQSTVAWWLVALSLLMLVVDTILAQRKVVAMGESFWPDLLRSGLGALLVALLFALPVVIAMATTTGSTPVMITLLLVITVLALATQILDSPLQRLLDRMVFVGRPQLQENRATLRATADALSRSNEAMALSRLDDQEFARLTRRALSNLGDLPRLAASPLIRLDAVDTRLQRQQGVDNTLTRAAILRDLLIESIHRLKPDAGPESHIAFDSSDAWRHYNALYFPYVLGLKPYSRRAFYDQLDEPTQQALDWFRSQVPERTLYNWQNGAAKLVAQYLQEMA